MLVALRDKLMRRDLFEDFCREYVRELNRLRMEHRASLSHRRQELAAVEREIRKLIQALKDVNGRAEDREAFAAALRKAQVKGPMGMASFDERQGMVADVYVLKVVRKGGQLENQCIERIPQVKDPYDLFP